MRPLWGLHPRGRWHRLLSCVAVEPGKRAVSLCGVTFWAVHGINPTTGRGEWQVYDVQPDRGTFCRRCAMLAKAAA